MDRIISAFQYYDLQGLQFLQFALSDETSDLTTGTAKLVDNFSASTLATRSVPPPAGNPTTILIESLNVDCAVAGNSNTVKINAKKYFIMVVLSSFC
jgi:hypothetical protein